MDLEVAWEEDEVSYRLLGRVGESGPELTRVEIGSARALTAADLRRSLLSTFIASLGRTEGAPAYARHRHGRARDRTAPANRLNEVAAVARRASYGQRTRHVAETFGISPGYARQLVSRAKAAGFQVW